MDHAETATEDPRRCTCHPDDNPPRPCPRKYALTHCRAADLHRRLQNAIVTAINDDLSDVGTEKRRRHLDRLDVMSAAAEFLQDHW